MILNSLLLYAIFDKYYIFRRFLREVNAMLNKIRKIKPWQVILFILIIGIVFLGVKYINEHTFSTDRWIKYPDERVKMVNDLFRKHSLAGLSKDQVVEY